MKLNRRAAMETQQLQIICLPFITVVCTLSSHGCFLGAEVKELVSASISALCMNIVV